MRLDPPTTCWTQLREEYADRLALLRGLLVRALAEANVDAPETIVQVRRLDQMPFAWDNKGMDVVRHEIRFLRERLSRATSHQGLSVELIGEIREHLRGGMLWENSVLESTAVDPWDTWRVVN